ncbi:predicted protein [Naegleria gruberi]|uniref:Predicted protein n=1 Tax=Naegleria gruberi TaxID=5762 RepID=D2VVS1_NAEGR|nr:uncharacterized protein NAEGRDRAFT_52652 [Naegleria gruberi]EFC39087.1 predicted protein [Naegleria gruberi]|eukprot:XP_002671831.1 predicted protein [Naegleria gruberi strain NEG-M]
MKNPQRLCTTCLEEENEELLATHSCSTCSLKDLCSYHAKKHERNLHQIIQLIPGMIGGGVDGEEKAPFCKDHFIPINCYCSDCNVLICSTCIVSGGHLTHGISLISEVVMKERKIIGEELERFINRVEEWRSIHQMEENHLLAEIEKVKTKGKELEKQIHLKFDELHNNLTSRKQELITQVYSVVERQCAIVNYVKKNVNVEELKQEFKDLLIMDGYTMMEKKTRVLKKSIADFDLLLDQLLHHVSLECLDNFTIRNIDTDDI